MIGVSNFTTKKVQELLAVAKIPQAVNQVGVDHVHIRRLSVAFTIFCDIILF
jgi:diketogulonate reductase-like aldo/keto reductase